ncbi:MAG: flagellar motor switch protein FliG [Planctomycetes bacterium]|nr:flagellar motor switch protein FliG [Planctomycetota bacterium]
MAKSKTKVYQELPGIRRAAIFFASLDQQVAAPLMAALDKATLEEVSKEIARLNVIDKDMRDRAFREFWGMFQSQQFVNEGGAEVARSLVRAALPMDEAEAVVDTVNRSLRLEPFAFLKKAAPEVVARYIKEEHPQTVGLILSHLPKELASGVLRALPAASRLDVLKRVAGLKETNPETIRQVEAVLKERIGGALDAPVEKVEGAKTAAEMIKQIPDAAQRRETLERLEEEDPELYEEVMKYMHVITDLATHDDGVIKTLVRNTPADVLAVALCGADEEIREKVYQNMSRRAAAALREDIELGPHRTAREVEDAQKQVAENAAKAAEAEAGR